MDKERVQGSGRDQNVTLDPSPGVEKQGNKAFDLWIESRVLRYLLTPVLRCLVWSVAKVHLFRDGAFSERNDFEFLGAKRSHCSPPVSSANCRARIKSDAF
jgi:hypothetical protein